MSRGTSVNWKRYTPPISCNFSHCAAFFGVTLYASPLAESAVLSNRKVPPVPDPHGAAVSFHVRRTACQARRQCFVACLPYQKLLLSQPCTETPFSCKPTVSMISTRSLLFLSTDLLFVSFLHSPFSFLKRPLVVLKLILANS